MKREWLRILRLHGKVPHLRVCGCFGGRKVNVVINRGTASSSSDLHMDGKRPEPHLCLDSESNMTSLKLLVWRGIIA